MTVKKIKPMDKSGNYHAMTLRMNANYNAYLDNLAFATRLDKAQIIRLLIHLSPFNEEFNQIMDRYKRADRKNHWYWVNDWEQDEDNWKWAKE